MVTFNTAIDLIKKTQLQREVIELDLINALHHICAEDVIAPMNFPPFQQSAMDGYVVRDLENCNEYQLINTIKAGDDASLITLQNNECSRIFTGAMLPVNSFAVIKQEDIIREGNRIKITKKIKDFENIRSIGDQTKKGEIVLREGNIINPGCIGFLAMLGIFKIKVFKKPSIIILATGNELTKQGEVLSLGKIYESNTYTLIAALKQFGYDSSCVVIDDDIYEIERIAKKAIEEHDLILFTGGISVGDYDFVHEVLLKLQVKEIFYKVKQKPGKPLFFGQKKNKLIFALPGNPAAVLTSFYVFVLEALSLLIGQKNKQLRQTFLKLNENYHKSINLTSVLKGKCFEDKVIILKDQSSAMLSSFVEADCLIILPEGKSEFKESELVEIILIN